MKKSLLYILASLTLLASCKGGEDVALEDHLKITPKTVTVDAKGGNFTVNATAIADVTHTIPSGSEWITPANTKSENPYKRYSLEFSAAATDKNINNNKLRMIFIE